VARDPAQADRLAQALRVNLRRRKAAATPIPAPELKPETGEARDSSPRDPPSGEPQA
jgi:hypothetical protein